MSHQTGIKASAELISFIGHAKEGNSIRVLAVKIEEEQLVLSSYEPPHGSVETDWDRLLLPMLTESQPCYAFVRLDTQNAQGYEWVYIAYTPDTAEVRQKMLYAGTKATLKTEFGSGHIKDELFGSLPSEVSFSGYKKHQISQSAPAPLTSAEEELEVVKQTEVNTAVNIDTKHETLPGIAFPVSEDALLALKQISRKELTYAQLLVDTSAETIELASTDNIDAHRLASHIPTETARYHFFLFKHTHEGDYLESIVFIYSNPGYKATVRERMLYSSCKAPLVEMCEGTLQMEIARKVEVDDPKEVTESFIYEEVHPKKTIVRNKFEKPKGPAGRGPRRMTKQATSPQ